MGRKVLVISRPVVLILGAGASAEYGLPTGQELLGRLLNCLDPRLQGTMANDYLAVLGAADFPIERVVAFRNALAQARVGTVDAFLAKQTAYRRIGRAAIAAALVPFEDEQKTHKPPDQPGWFELLFRLMTEGREPFEENQLSVITFNYDRSFEHLLYGALRNLYPGGDSGARRRLASIPVVHLHGTLGGYPPLNKGRGRWYEATLNQTVVRSVEKDIKIIPDDDDHDGRLDGDDDFSRAYERLEEAELVVILGFGFDPLNIRRLALVECLNPHARVITTSKGLSPEALQAFKETAEIKGELTHHDVTCTELLRRFGHLLIG